MNAIRVGWLFFKLGAMNDLQYRVNFFVQLFQSVVQLLTGLTALWLIFSRTSQLDGWTPAQLIVIMGVYTFMGGLIQTTIQPNMERLMDEIQQGTLDYALTKPEDAQLLASVREVRIWQSVDMLTGLVVMGIGIAQLQSRVGLLDALSFLAVMVLGGLMIYCFWLMIATATFWLIRLYNIGNLFQGIYAAGRFPIGIYPGWLRFGLTFLVPVAFAVTIPAEALTGRLSVQTIGGAVALTFALLTLSRWMWRRGLRRYSGASA